MVKYNDARVKEVMIKTFDEAQQTNTSHNRLVKTLKKVYDNSNFETFLSEFIRCLKLVLVVAEKYPTVENTLNFAAKFAVSFQPVQNAEDELEEDNEGPFLQRLFNFCMQTHAAVDVSGRYRICFFVNLLLKSMNDDASLSDRTIEEIRNTMAERLLDKSFKVRVQAIAALHRVQEPMDEGCPIKQMYIFHMSKDPNAEVRKAAIQYSAKTQKTLQAVLKRINDVDESVRKAAYVFLSRVTVKSLTIKQRQCIIKTGLKDSSESVRKTLKDAILSAWLIHYQNDYCQLLYGLDSEMESELGILVLNTLFERESLDQLFKQLPLDREAKLIPIDQLNSDNVLYWRCFIHYLHKKGANEMLDDSVPELTTFCNYIRDFQAKITEFPDPKTGDTEENALNFDKRISLQFIHLQLFEIAKIFDLSDEVGRGNLRQLIDDTLMSDICTVKITECIVKYYAQIVPDVSSRLNSLAHVISEIRMPTRLADNIVEEVSDEEVTERLVQCQKLKNILLQRENDQYLLVQAKKFGEAEVVQKEMEDLQKQIKELSKTQTLIEPQTQEEERNDPETMIKCLTIMFTMIQAPSIKTLTSTLRSLFDNLAMSSVDHTNEAVQSLALKAAGICLCLDGELARKHLLMYFVAMTTDHDNNDLWLTSLAVIFDTFLRYGLDHFKDLISNDQSVDGSRAQDTSRRHGSTRLFSNSDDTGLSVEIDSGDQRNNLIKILLDLIDHLDRDIRTAAVTGFCKLLLHGKIKSNSLLSSLIIRLFDPVTVNDVDLRGTLVNFFKIYPHFTPDGSSSLQQAFIPTMKKLVDAPYNMDFQEIDPFNIAKFIIDLTSSYNHKLGKENFDAHNQLAFDILKELADDDTDIDGKTLIKSLKLLAIRCENNEMKDRMKEAVDKVIDIVDPRERTVIKSLELFRKQFEEAERVEEPQEAENGPENEPSSQEREQEEAAGSENTPPSQEQENMEIEDDSEPEN